MKKIGIYFLAFTLLGFISCGRGQQQSQSESEPESEIIEIMAEPEAEAEALDSETDLPTSAVTDQPMQQEVEPATRPEQTRPASVTPTRPEAPVRDPERSDMERIRPAPDETIRARPDTIKLNL